MTARKLGSFTSGESEAVTGSGPSEPATKRGVPGPVRPRDRPRFARLCAAATFISCDERAELRIVDHALEELGVLAPVLRFARKEEIVQADGGGAESVCFDDVRAGFEILGVDLFDDLRLGELEKLELAFEIFAFALAKRAPR